MPVVLLQELVLQILKIFVFSSTPEDVVSGITIKEDEERLDMSDFTYFITFNLYYYSTAESICITK